MDLELARTFLEIARTGSFLAAAERLHVTRTAVTARVQNLEAQLQGRLFVRNRAGARLTADGQVFAGYASQLVQTWDAARRDLPLPEGFRNLLTVGGEVSLSNPLILNWVKRLREALPGYAVRAEIADSSRLQQQEEKLIQVCSVAQPEPYIYIDWGEAFRKQHDAAMPEKAKAALSFSLGPLALQYLVQNGGAGYFRTRVVQSYLDNGILQRVERAPEFTYPTYLVYSRDKETPVLQDAIQLLRDVIGEDADWSQRWEG